MSDLIDRKAAIDAVAEAYDNDELFEGYEYRLEALPSAQPKEHEIGYPECSCAMLKMWIDNVLTDGEYSRIMNKLNAHWAERREG